MLDKFLVLLERFVVAHELIATNAARSVSTESLAKAASGPYGKEQVKDEPKKATKGKAKPEPEDDLGDDEPAPKKTRAKKEAPKGPDLEELRDEIKTMAQHIAAGVSDECADKFDELLEDFKVRTVTKLHDDDLEEFHKEAKALVGKYYEIED